MDTGRQLPGRSFLGPSMNAIGLTEPVNCRQSECAQTQAQRHTDPGADPDQVEDYEEHQVADEDAACKEDILPVESLELDGAVDSPVDRIVSWCLHLRDQKSF